MPNSVDPRRKFAGVPAAASKAHSGEAGGHSMQTLFSRRPALSNPSYTSHRQMLLPSRDPSQSVNSALLAMGSSGNYPYQNHRQPSLQNPQLNALGQHGGGGGGTAASQVLVVHREPTVYLLPGTGTSASLHPRSILGTAPAVAPGIASSNLLYGPTVYTVPARVTALDRILASRLQAAAAPAGFLQNGTVMSPQLASQYASFAAAVPDHSASSRYRHVAPGEFAVQGTSPSFDWRRAPMPASATSTATDANNDSPRASKTGAVRKRKRAEPKVKRTFRRGIKYKNDSFPCKLLRLLIQMEEEGNAKEIAGFLEDGQRFYIRDKVKLENYLPKFFRHGKFNSFKRLLYMYDFERYSSETKGEVYYHPEFDRSKPEKCHEMTRKNSTLAQIIREKQSQKKAQAKEEAEQNEEQEEEGGDNDDEEEENEEEKAGEDEDEESRVEVDDDSK